MRNVKRRGLAAIFSSLLFMPAAVSAEHHLRATDRGVEADALSAKAAAQTAHWGQLVGNWRVLLEELAPDGSVIDRYDGEWNFFYTLGGEAIQDVFILPPRAEDRLPEDHFYGSGIRIFDGESNKWRVVWIDTGGRSFELREATSTKDRILMTMSEGENDRRWLYFDFQKDSFQWKQENMIGGKWVTDQRLTATRVQ